MGRQGPSRVYVSSPFKGLERERSAVIAAIARLQHLPVHMERYGADARPVLEKVLTDVRESDVFVLLLGWRYGVLVDGKSYTHWEYDTARALKKPMFAYLTPERARRTASPTDDPPGTAIDTWRAAVKAEGPRRGYTPFTFEDAAELEKQVLADLGRWLGESGVRPRSTAAPAEGMVVVPAGDALTSAGRVTVPGFWIDRCAVSNEQFAEFLAASGYEPEQPKGFLEAWHGREPPVALRRHPVVCVDWHDASAFARWAGKDLPTYAEWTRAARGDDGRPYPWGARFDASRSNSREGARGATVPVDALPAGASPFGCLGMAGNVSEWTSSWLEAAAARTRVVCGGSWATPLALGGLDRVENRLPGDRDHRTGFRCVWRAAPPGPAA
jgi:hypothetical protein